MGRFNIEDRKVMAGLDLGTGSVKLVIGVLSSNGMEIVGTSKILHRGLHKGRIVNMKETSEAIRQACEEAEVTAGLQITQLFLGINGDYNIFSSQGMSIIPSHQVTTEDVNKAVETAKAVPLPSGHRLLHVLPNSFTVDGEDPVFNPLGLSGLRLETNVLMISLPESGVQNVLQCLRYAGHSARGLVLQPLAVSLAVLSEDEKQSGTCVMDIGQDQTALTVVMDNRIQYIGSLSIGGEDFTHDLMMKLKVPRDQAESIKLQYGKSFSKEEWNKGDMEWEESSDSSDLTVDMKEIDEVMTVQSEILFQKVRQRLESLKYFDRLRGGIVLTGGGSFLEGLSETGKFIVDIPIKKAQLLQYSDTDQMSHRSELATALGVLEYVQQEQSIDYRSDHLEGKVFKIKRWVQDLLP